MRFLPAITSARDLAFSLTDGEARGGLSRPGHTLTEVLKGGTVTKIYLDYDFVLTGRAKDAGPLLESEIEPHMTDVVERLDHVCHMLDFGIKDSMYKRMLEEGNKEDKAQLAPEPVPVRYAIATRHGWCAKHQAWKISVRPFFIGVRVPYDLIPEIMRVTGQLLRLPLALGQTQFWDLSVYKPGEQLLACINGSKGGADQRELVPHPLGGRPVDLLDYVAQHVEDAWPLMTPTPEKVGEGVNASAADTDMLGTRPDSTVPEPLLRRIVDALAGRRADERKAWTEVIWTIQAVSTQNGYGQAGEGIAHEFSKRCGPKYNASAVTKIYGAGREGGVGIGSLLYWVKQDNVGTPHVYREIQAALRAAKGRAKVQVEVVRGGVQFHEDDGDFITFREGQMVSRERGGLVGSAQGSDVDDTIRNNIMRQLASAFPEKFADIMDHPFIMTKSQDGIVKFTTDGFQGYLDGYCVHLADGTFLGTLCNDIPFMGPVTIHKDTPAHTDYVFNRQSVCHSTLSSINPADTTMSFVQNPSDYRMALVDIAVLGRKNVRVTDKKKMGVLEDQINKAVRAHMESIIGPQCGVWLFINNGTINVNMPVAGQLVGADGTEAKRPSEFAQINTILVDTAAELGLRKHDGIVYEPIPSCPCAFVVRCTYEKYINTVLKDDEIYNDNPRRFEELMKHMKTYEVTKFPLLEPDLDLLSFSNGVMQLVTGVFTPYDGIALADGFLAKRVARHHINQPYTGCVHTPLLDVILDAQFGSDVAQILCALLGRTFFQVGQLDKWQVMPFLVGVGGTGKSLLLNILEHLFAPGSIGNLAAKREEVFGMANLLEKELVLGRDMPAKMSASLTQDTMQSMTAGEGMEIPRKGMTALQKRWTAPVIMAGNNMPDYVNTGNNVGRRMVSVRFDNTIDNPQEDLEDRIILEELPNITCRFLTAYRDLRETVKLTKGGFWKAVPAEMLKWRGILSAATNKVEEFLSMDDDKRGYIIELVDGAVTWELDFIEVYESKKGAGIPYVADLAVLKTRGFEVSKEKVQMCKSCKQASKGRPEQCCLEYSRTNRGLKTVIYNMKMTAVGERSVGDE